MKVGYVALIGRPNVGKSTLINKMLGQKVAIISSKPQTTRTTILGIKTTGQGQIIFVDNPGIHKPLHKLNKRMMKLVYSSLETSNLVCLIIDSKLSFGHGDQFVIDILKNISTPIILLINKVDIIKKEKILSMIERYKDLIGFKEIIPISALKGTNLDILEEKIYFYLPESKKIFEDDKVSDQSQQFLLSEIIREKILKYVREELPFVTAVHIDKIEKRTRASDSADRAMKNYIKASIFVEKDNHRRIILGKRGMLIKTIGTQARQEIEQILGEKIFLELQIKVKKRWRDSANVLDLIERQ